MAHSENRIQVISITDLSRGGAGVGREESGRAVFVPLTAPGDKVRVRITKEEKRYAEAELLEVIEPSPLRVSAPCPAFGKCGGCQWQHLPYEFQWKTKSSGVRHALKRVGLESPEDWTELPADRAFGYRNRIQLRGFREQMGFFAAKSRNLISIENCLITRDEINHVLAGLKQEGAKLPEMYKVEVEVMPSGEVRHAWNSPHAALGFRQVNDEQNEKLKSWVSSALTPGREVFDLFGGSGNLSLPLTSTMARIDCVDVSAPSSPPEGTPANLSFHRSAVLPWLLRAAKKASGQSDLPARSAIVDPPRTGLGSELLEIANSLEKLGVVELVAVGCDPDSWASDLSRFVKRGWRLGKVAVLDLFPQTPHVESVALLRR